MGNYNYQIEKDSLPCEPRAALALMNLVFERSNGTSIKRIPIVMGMYSRHDAQGCVYPMFARKFVDWLRNGCDGLFSGEYVLLSTSNEFGDSSHCADWHSHGSRYPKIKATREAYETICKLSLGWESGDEGEWFCLATGYSTNDPESAFCDVFLSNEFVDWAYHGDERIFTLQHAYAKSTDQLESLLTPVALSVED